MTLNEFTNDCRLPNDTDQRLVTPEDQRRAVEALGELSRARGGDVDVAWEKLFSPQPVTV